MRYTKDVLFVLVVLLSQPVEAQLLQSVGLKAGVVFANQHWTIPSVNVTTESRVGFDAGISFEWLDQSYFSVLTEVHYVQKGSQATTDILVADPANPDGPGEHLKFNSRVDYISFLILAKLKMERRAVTPYLLLGPSLDIFISDHSESLGAALRDSKKLEFSGVLGAGVEIETPGQIEVGVEFRYHPSFQDSYSSQSTNVKNDAMEILLTLRYPLVAH